MDTMIFASKKLSISNAQANQLITILGKDKVMDLIYMPDPTCDKVSKGDDPERDLKTLKSRFGNVIAELHRQNQADGRAISGLKNACQERTNEINRIRNLFDFYTPKPK